ncbi:MAG: hypothetical protein AB7G13_20085 [Lautropia sp.]
MSLSATVEIGSADVRRLVVGAVAVLLAAALAAATVEQVSDGVASRWGLVALLIAGSVAAALVAIVVFAVPRAATVLRIRADGRCELTDVDAGGAAAAAGAVAAGAAAAGAVLPAEIVAARRLPGAIHLQLRPAGVAGDAAAADSGQSLQAGGLARWWHPGRSRRIRRHLLARRCVDAAQWAALNRWIVWRRRGGALHEPSDIVLTRSA